MEYDSTELKFLATPDKGNVSGLLIEPENARCLLVLGHGASTNMRHPTMEQIAQSLANNGIATLRYNFPYAENGTGRDSTATCTACVRAAVATARKLAPKLDLLAGGHSFGGRMTSTAASESALEGVSGIIFFSFPLHMPDRPGIARAEHLNLISIPMLFLSGTRDKLADLDLLKSVCENLKDRATLHLLDTADHGYKIQKRIRQNSEDVFEEMSRVASEWSSALT